MLSVNIRGSKVTRWFGCSTTQAVMERMLRCLIASRMNAKPGGKQPLLRDTVWDGKVQRMVYSIGVAKGLIQVLKERGRYRPGMKLEEMKAEISTHPDFRTKIEH